MLKASTAPSPNLYDAVFAVARRRFLADGYDGLAVRAIAEEAGCTTMAIYTHFGGKDGLVQAFFDEGFARLAAAQQAVPLRLPPRERVLALCHAYRRLAHDFPHHYDLMLGAQSARFQPAPESRGRALATITTLAEALAPLQSSGAETQSADDHAHAVIAFCHGWVTLERAGLLTLGARQDRAFERGIQLLLSEAGNAAKGRTRRATP